MLLDNAPMTPRNRPRPGDLLLDRYCKGADREVRERAREAFKNFACALAALGEAQSTVIPDSPESESCGRIPSLETT